MHPALASGGGHGRARNSLLGRFTMDGWRKRQRITTEVSDASQFGDIRASSSLLRRRQREHSDRCGSSGEGGAVLPLDLPGDAYEVFVTALQPLASEADAALLRLRLEHLQHGDGIAGVPDDGGRHQSAGPRQPLRLETAGRG